MAACERCSSPGACAACPLLRRPQSIEFGEKVLTVNRLKEVPEKFKGIINFNPVRLRQRGGELPVKTGEIICFICKEKASTCRHSKSKTSALAAA